MKRYVAGFLFNQFNEVALIEKKRPEWQKDRWNGIGGHIEEGETEHEAMVREFREETGLHIEKWTQFVVVYGDGYEVYFFKARIERTMALAKMTEETPHWWPLKALPNIVSNLDWLIPMANYKYDLDALVYHKSPEC